MKRDTPAAAEIAMISVPARLHFSLIEQALLREDILGDFRQRPAYLERPLDDAPSIRLDNLPAIGDDFERGKLAGITVHEGVPMALVLLPDPGEDETVDWADAKKWALEAGGELPSRIDSLVLWQNRKALGGFREEWYWTSEQAASDASYAWMQDFFLGTQGCNHTSNKCRARAVRRVPIR